MSEPSPVPVRAPLFTPRVIKLAAIAFGVGLLLFLLIWLDQRNDNDFFKPGAPGSVAPAGEPLPAPVPADVASETGNASGLGLPRDAPTRPATGGEQPRVVEPAMPAPAAMPTTEPSHPASTADVATPVPVSTPAPRYPQEALRRGVGGTVRVRVTVAPDGSVERMDLAAGSGNRFLDRAALDTVRRWRFKPATRNGQPISAEVIVPLEFNPKG